MTAEVRRSPESRRRDLPDTGHLRHPARRLLHSPVRGAVAAAIRGLWDLEVRGAQNVPARGPVVMVGNHIGFLDGPLMAIVGPRPAHALTKDELFSGPLGAFLVAAGQIPVDRDIVDPLALKTALKVLRDGGVAGLFPERTRGDGTMAQVAGGAAYLAMAAGGTVVPVSFLGTRLPGEDATFPPRGTRLVMSIGEPFAVEQQDWPRRAPEVRALSDRIKLAVIANAEAATRATGIELPGPLPDTGTASGPQSSPNGSKDMQ